MRRLRGDHHPRVQLSASLGIDRKTVRKYLAPAIADGVEPCGEPLSAEQWAELIGGWFPELSDPAARASTWPLIAPYHDRIKEWLDADVTVATTAQRLRDDHGVAASESSVRRWITTHFAEELAREKVTVPRGRWIQVVRRRSITAGWACGWTRRRPSAWGVGVRDGAVVFPAPVRAPGDPDGSNHVVRVPCRRIRVLRRGTGTAGL